MKKKIFDYYNNNKILYLITVLLIAALLVPAFLFDKTEHANSEEMRKSLQKPDFEISVAKLDALKLKWNDVEGATSYLIFRALSPADDFEIVGATRDNKYIDGNLNPKTKYYYRVKAVGKKYNYISSSQTISCETYMPKINLIAFDYSSDYWKIMWADLDVAEKYIMYRSKDKDGKYEKVREFDAHEDHVYYAKKEGRDQGYYYKVKSVSEIDDNVYSSISFLPAKSVRLYMNWPVPKHTATDSSYGWRFHPIYYKKVFHEGVDITCDYGTKIYAAADGRVIAAGYVKYYLGLGNAVWIDHGNNIVTKYAHNSEILVKEGDEVKKGQLIAKAGSTGAATGPHCHFEVRVKDKPTNPLQYFKEDHSEKK